MKTADAALLKCPRLLAEKNANHQFCITTKCMAWIDWTSKVAINKGTPEEARVNNPKSEAIGVCSEYGPDSKIVYVEQA